MGKIYLGLVLTLLVSLIVIICGLLISRKTVTEVKVVDRESIRQFQNELGDLVEAQKEARDKAMKSLAFELSQSPPKDVEDRLGEIQGVRGVYLFPGGLPGKSWLLLGPIGSPSPAEVIVEGKKIPLNPKRAITIPRALLKEVTFGQSGRVDNEEGTFHGWWYSPLQGAVVVFLIESKVAESAFATSLQERASEDFTRVKKAGESIKVTYAGRGLFGETLEARDSTFDTGRGPISIKAWDWRKSRKTRDRATIFGSLGLAIVIAGMGLVLFFSQRRMWQASERRVSFVNRVSHELGTPLTNMTLNLELASRALRSQPEMAGRRLEKMSEEVSRLGRLVTNVLTHSRKSGDGIRDRAVICDPDAVISGVLDQFRPALERREIEVEWTPSGVGEQGINADALSQIVWNLISNVEKYGSSGRWLSVSVSHGDDDLKVQVCDRGEGIPRDRRAKIFKPFERVSDSTKEGVSGTGLGLSISRDLAESMGGTLTLLDDSQLTVFELMIPLKKS